MPTNPDLKISKEQERFNYMYHKESEKFLQLQALFYQKKQLEKLEKIRSNTSFIVGFIVFSFIMGILFAIFSVN